jgi:hypothetical protein
LRSAISTTAASAVIDTTRCATSECRSARIRNAATIAGSRTGAMIQ